MDRRALLRFAALSAWCWLLPAGGCGGRVEPVLRDTASAGLPMRGVNLAGAEFGHDKPSFCAEQVGVHGKDWIYPSEGTIAYFARQGLRLLRVPVRWERLQPRLGAELEPQELARLKRTLDHARAYGCKVVIDLHNYGRYALKVHGAPRVCVIDEVIDGRVPVSRAHLADLWRRVATNFRAHEGLGGYGLMNEPYDMGASDWKAMSQEAVRAIRTVDLTRVICVAGEHWSSSAKWSEVNGPTAWIDDPAGRVVYEAHCYFDADASGRYELSYDEEWSRDPDLPQRPLQRLENFARWCAANKVPGYLGEYGVPRDDARWNELLAVFVARLDELDMDSSVWAAGEWWGDYPLSVQPGHAYVTDAPVLKVLKRKRA